MCIYYYVHHHHIPPCTRALDFTVHYAFCENASTPDPSPVPSTTPTLTPCGTLTYAPPGRPCPAGAGGCVESARCAAGGCRLDALGGRWACCRCARRGNTRTWCGGPLPRIPDALCYHVVCQGCRRDG
ncbi:hypothetical protein F4780DRAFT_781969 [Xylariomycetidae sp. FL0641]|nr:hypothetical protein F4780DRAFT_781969 [Xylariomycetidae sp. FL0641]